MNPANSDWWWRYGLDGILAGLFGGLVTALAVWWTLSHERRLGSRLAAQESAAILISAVQRLRSTIDVEAGEFDARAASAASDEMYAAAQVFMARLWRQWPSPADLISGLLDRYEEIDTRVSDRPWRAQELSRVSPLLGGLIQVAALWLHRSPRPESRRARRASRRRFADAWSQLEPALQRIARQNGP